MVIHYAWCTDVGRDISELCQLPWCSSPLIQPAWVQAWPCLHGHVTGNAPNFMRIQVHPGLCCPGLHGFPWDHLEDHCLRVGPCVSQVCMATHGPLATWDIACWQVLP